MNKPSSQNKNDDLTTWIRAGFMVIVIAIATTVIFLGTSLQFASRLDIINEIDMHPEYTNLSFNENEQNLILTSEDGKQAKFKLTKEDYKYLQPRLEEEDWGGWTFTHITIPAKENRPEHEIHSGTRPKQ